MSCFLVGEPIVVLPSNMSMIMCQILVGRHERLDLVTALSDLGHVDCLHTLDATKVRLNFNNMNGAFNRDDPTKKLVVPCATTDII